MNLLKFYIILTIVGILLEVLVFVLGSNEGMAEQMVICLIAGVVFMIIGIRGVAGKFKSYM